MTELPIYIQNNITNMILDHPIGAEWNQIEDIVFSGKLDARTENLVVACQSPKAVVINLHRYSWKSVSKPSTDNIDDVFKNKKSNLEKPIPNQYKPLLDYILYFVRWERESWYIVPRLLIRRNIKRKG